MELGKAVVGAIIGAALGIGLLVLVHRWADGVWLAIPVAILTGLGARMMAAKGDPSYLRGAITGVLALAAYWGGSYLVAEIAMRRAAVPIARGIVEPEVERPVNERLDDPAEAPALTPPPEEPPAFERRDGIVARRAARDRNVWDFLALCIAALVAYELGRGSGMPGGTSRPDGETGEAADPALSRDGDTSAPPPEVIRPPD